MTEFRKSAYDILSAVQRAIVGFHRDEQTEQGEPGDWVAELDCGHNQHVRHRPPWTLRPWVVTPEGRQARIGQPLDCKLCDERAPAPR